MASTATVKMATLKIPREALTEALLFLILPVLSFIFMMQQKFTLQAPAKINLYLKVLNQREDGFHNLTSLMQMVGLYDTLTFEAKPDAITLQVEKSSLPADHSNLVMKAAILLQKALVSAGYPRKGVFMTLQKEIPLAAGLAGGSSDAVSTLIGLNQLWGLHWPKKRLAELSESLGSDLPFFFDGPTAWVSGRGEMVESAPSPFSGWVVLVNPEISVSTASVFRDYSAQSGLTKIDAPLNIKPDKGWPSTAEILRHTANDLEKVTLNRFPKLKAIKSQLQERGARLVLMSGSGPTLFGLFKDEQQAKHVAEEIRALRQHHSIKVWSVPLLQKSPY